MKKMSFMTLLILVTFQLKAAPILNNNMAAEGTLITIWSDHQDRNHFYFAPNLMKLALGKDDLAKFNLTEYWVGGCGRFTRCHKKGMLSAFFEAGFRDQQLREAQAGILKLNPNARFSAIPFLSSHVDFGKSMSPFIDKHDCAPQAGQVSDEVPCTMILNAKGLKTLKPFLKEGKTLPFKFVYRISGVIEGANGTYKDEVLHYGLTVNLGGEQLVHHPDLE